MNPTEFTIKLAGIPIGISALYPSTREFCRDYLTEEEPEFSVCITPEDIAAEQQISETEGRTPGVRFADSRLEPLALYRKLLEQLIRYDTILMHGAVLEMDGRAYMFTAPSGTGKTTHIRLWLDRFGDRVRVLNGDKPLLRFTENGILVCGTPWQGKENYGCNRTAPLEAICFVQRAEQNSIEDISQFEALTRILQQVYRISDREGNAVSVRLTGRLCREVKLRKLLCNMDPEAAEVAYRGLV